MSASSWVTPTPPTSPAPSGAGQARRRVPTAPFRKNGSPPGPDEPNGSGALQMLLKPRHQLDQVAGAPAAVELPFENIVPAVAAGAGRAGQGEEVGATGDPA